MNTIGFYVKIFPHMTTPIEAGTLFDRKLGSLAPGRVMRSETFSGKTETSRLEVPLRFIDDRWLARPGFLYEEGIEFEPSAHVDLVRHSNGAALRSINITLVPKDLEAPSVFYNLKLTDEDKPTLRFGQGETVHELPAGPDVLAAFVDLIDWALPPLPEIEKYMLQLQEMGDGCYSEAEFRLLKDTLKWVAEHHRGVFRRNGDPFLSHPVAAALTSLELGVDNFEVIQATLGHDVPEDSKEYSQPYGMKRSDWEEKMRRDLIETKLFGSKAISIMIKMARPKADGQEINTREEANKIYHETVASDPDVIWVKMNDKLHNLRTLGALTDNEIDAVIREMNEVWWDIFVKAYNKYPQTRTIIGWMIEAIRDIRPDAEIPDVLSRIDEMARSKNN